jgi:hypothetical protein
VADFDGDDWPDLYLTNSRFGEPNALYRNKHDGTFEDVAAAAGLADLNRPGEGVSMGAVWGDMDGDGREDVLSIATATSRSSATSTAAASRT